MLNSAKGNFSEYLKVEALKHCIDERSSVFTCNRDLSNVFETASSLSFSKFW